jgi:hypothetical protein
MEEVRQPDAASRAGHATHRDDRRRARWRARRGDDHGRRHARRQRDVRDRADVADPSPPRSFAFVNGTATEQVQWPIANVGSILSFGPDASGQLYVLSANGTVYRIVAG